MIDGRGISCEIAIRWMLLDLTDDKSTLVQVMACCRQTTSHYLNQCWPRFMSPYGVTRPRWINWSRNSLWCSHLAHCNLVMMIFIRIPSQQISLQKEPSTLLQTPLKLLGFYWAEEGFWADFADFKHNHTQAFYWSYSFFYQPMSVDQ